MEFEWMKFPQVADVFDEAATLAKGDKSSFVTEWHLMLSLLRFDTVWDSFSPQEKFKKRLFAHAAKASDNALKPGATPELKPRFRARLLAAAEERRQLGDRSLPSPLLRKVARYRSIPMLTSMRLVLR